MSESPVPDQDARRSTSDGEVIGFVGRYGEHAWLGIPYASPPLGELRWRAPRNPGRRSGPHFATAAGPACAQRIPVYIADAASLGGGMGSEDCLYLNIWSPAFSPDRVPAGDERLPVMFWIHGGANVSGQASTYAGGVLATSERVIVVSANYRLGVLGWFRHRSLRADTNDSAEQSGNFGTLDLIFALKWVRQNIASFGGDPGNVTIFGESAGGGNVYSLLVSERAAGLFHRAIVQSGTPETFNVEEAENLVDNERPGSEKSSGELVLALLIEDGRASGRDGAKALVEKMSLESLAGYLRGKSFSELDAAYQRLEAASSDPASPLRPFPSVFRDGSVLPHEGIMAALATKVGYNDVPVILGTTRDEFTVLLPLISGSLLAEPVEAGFGFTIKDKVRYALVAEYLAKLLKAYAVDEPARAICGHSPGRVFVYRFDWDELPPAPWLDGISPGATHGLDVPFVFGHLDLGPEFFQLPLIRAQSLQSFRALAAKVMSYWAAFADRGDPGKGHRGELPYWEPWTHGAIDKGAIMLLDGSAHGGVRMGSSFVTKETALAELAGDPRLVSDAERMRLVEDLLRIGGPYSLLAAEDRDRFANLLEGRA